MSNPPVDDARVELCLRIDRKMFGVSFTDLETAREAARHINLSGRDVQIYERYTGRVLEESKAVQSGKPRMGQTASGAQG